MMRASLKCVVSGLANNASDNSNSWSLCATAVLIPNRDQTYTYIACGPSAVTITYYATTTITAADSTMSSDSIGVSSEGGSEDSSELSALTTPETSPGLVAESASGAAASADQKDGGGSSTNVGAIVGGVLGEIAILCATVVLVIWIRRRRTKPAQYTGAESSPSPERKEYRYEPAPKTEAIHELPGQSTGHNDGGAPTWRQSLSELSGSSPSGRT